MAKTIILDFCKKPESVLVRIEKGSTARQIAQILKANQVIKFPRAFLLLSKITGKSRSFKHGTYLFNKNHYWETIRKLDLGLSYKIKVTLPEGWTSHQVAEKLQLLGIVENKELFLQEVKKNQLDGMLFPETYFFEPLTAPGLIIKEMYQMFIRNYTDDFKIRAKELKMSDLKVITLASIIERETKIDSERPLVSSVFHNRLKKGWFLAADPTVQYALSEGKFWKEQITYKDVKVMSPYNTYRRTGLPPGPICSPGIKAIHAALYPAETNFLFFVADRKGGHEFFVTYEKHIQSQKKRSRHP